MSEELETRELKAGTDHAGVRLDKVVALLLDSRSQAQRALAEGRVSVDGRPVSKARSVELGQRITVRVPAEAPPAAVTTDSDVPVLYQDDAMLIVDKPAGMVVHPAPGHHGVTLVEALGGRTGGGPADRPGVVHRLDRDTSGLLVLARTEHALRTLQRSLSERLVKREYVALVQGAPPSRTGTIEAPIGRDPRERTRMAVDGDTPRDARTHFEVTEWLGAVSLLRVMLDTGRTHQIRVHMEAIGHPIVGDPVYGEGPAYGLERQWLHAARLVVPHPDTGEEVEVTSALPPDLEAALATVRAQAGIA